MTAQAVLATPATLDAVALRSDFPTLRRTINGHPLVYLDSAATSQKPQVVIDRMNQFYAEEYSTVRRSIHLLSAKATQAYEGTRRTVAQFLNAPETRQIIFTKGTTEGINLVAHGYGRKFIGAGDEIIISATEHHANIVPWQMLCEEKGAHLRVIPVDDRGELILEAYEQMLTERTKLVAIGHISNALGTIHPVEDIIRLAHAHGVPVLVDGAQAAPHMPVDVQALDCDFYVFSGHKACGPTGIGVLYGKVELLERMNPFLGGGDMIETVTFEKTTYAPLPHKFEAGTPAIAEVIGLGAALDYLRGIGLEAIATYEHQLLEQATARLSSIPGVRIIGTAQRKAAIVSFTVDGIHPHDIGTLLDQEGIAIRAGHHCAQPVMARYGVPATARASFAFYNLPSEVEALGVAIEKTIAVFAL
ncbi:cysteine desulfurase [Chloracidobacterium validum]|uniref:Cysteine desulfurase n=1 Tax=Chloracidobacterium validum TaxID=2821543 RepID=A0ABX8BC29_9BACT|nr:cysteine desulfurase [Chloracidobacterium validum]QUW04492.1 cysteine desulfurase [Chloracidobacterium validum]